MARLKAFSVALLAATETQRVNANDDTNVAVSSDSHIPVFEPAFPTDGGLIRDLCDFTAKLVADYSTAKVCHLQFIDEQILTSVASSTTIQMAPKRTLLVL
jgi:hypothetical protein